MESKFVRGRCYQHLDGDCILVIAEEADVDVKKFEHAMTMSLTMLELFERLQFAYGVHLSILVNGGRKTEARYVYHIHFEQWTEISYDDYLRLSAKNKLCDISRICMS